MKGGGQLEDDDPLRGKHGDRGHDLGLRRIDGQADLDLNGSE